MMEVKRYRPTGFHLFEEENGPVVKYADHEKSIAAAVLAERRRVWGALQVQIKTAYRESKKEIPFGDQYHSDKAEILGKLLLQLFPDGEPKEVNPPAGDRWEM